MTHTVPCHLSKSSASWLRGLAEAIVALDADAAPAGELRMRVRTAGAARPPLPIDPDRAALRPVKTPEGREVLEVLHRARVRNRQTFLAPSSPIVLDDDDHDEPKEGDDE